VGSPGNAFPVFSQLSNMVIGKGEGNLNAKKTLAGLPKTNNNKTIREKTALPASRDSVTDL